MTRIDPHRALRTARARIVLLAGLVASASAAGAPPDGVPVPRGGADRVGSAFPPLSEVRWIGDGSPPRFADAPVTLVRFWTDTCPFCRRSLPAIGRLAAAFGGDGLRVAGIYHPKPPRPIGGDASERLLARARALGFPGPVGVDPDWRFLRRVWLDTGRRRATSVTFLVDRRGTIRFVHPGPEFHPDGCVDGGARCAEDYRALERAITALIREDRASSPAE